MKNFTLMILSSVFLSAVTGTAIAQANAPASAKVCIHNKGSVWAIKACNFDGNCVSGLTMGLSKKLPVGSTRNSRTIQLYYLSGLSYSPTNRVRLRAGDSFYVINGKTGTGWVIHQQCF